jgi:uncharacterized protein (DUF342 family)
MKLPEFQELMRKQAQEDKKQKSVTVSAPTMPEALKKASIELSVGVSKVAYEVLQKGTTGTFGIGRKDWILMAYPVLEAGAAIEEESSDFGFAFGSAKSHAGQIFVRRASEGIMVKVTAPVGDGERVTEHQAVDAVEVKTSERINMAALAKAVKKADGEWVKVADREHIPTQDASIEVEITDMEMKAYVTIRAPGPHGADVSYQDIMNQLEMNHVMDGFLNEAMLHLEEVPVYGEPVLVAEGKRPEHGEDAKVNYTFEVDRKLNIKQIEGGRVDFRELNTINNVVEGQLLAKLVPPQRGKPGMTVTGKMLPAKDGKEKQLVVGNNVKLSDDKKQAIAAKNGQVIVTGDKITVEPIYKVDGNVGMRTGGNIVFLGSVEVTGNVEDGYSIKAAGNIEVHGTIEKCEIDCEGDLIVHNGITGKQGASIKAGGNIWSKFIENADVESGGMVVVSEGIINSNIQCDHKIICRGKRASIVGGNIRASEEIDAKTLGSVAGVETNLEVGFDPKLKTEVDGLQEKLKGVQKEQGEIELNMAGIEKASKDLARVKKELPQEKKDHLENLKKRAAELLVVVQGLQDDIARLQKQINELKNNGKISAAAKVYPGTKISIKDATLEIRTEYKAVSFIAEMGIVKMTRYEESDQDISVQRTSK